MMPPSLPGLLERVEALTPSQRARLGERLRALGSADLTAWVVTDERGPTAEELADFVGARLPAVMVPGTFFRVPSLPRTLAGKLDRGALAMLTADPLPGRGGGRGTRDPRPDSAPVVPAATAADDPTVRALIAIWKEVLDLDEVRLDDDFFEVGGDSLLSIRVIAKAAKAGIDIGPDAFFESPTIAYLAAAAGARRDPSGPLVPISTGGERPPLIAVPGVGGEVSGLVRLARMLGDGQPFYGLQSRGLAGEAAPLQTIEAIAADFVDHVGDLTRGPYDLLGICWGATVAFEMARALTEAGRPPRWVALMNPAVLLRQPDVHRESARIRFLKDRIDLYWDEFRELDWRSRGRMLVEKARRASEVALRRPDADTPASEIQRMRVQEANRVAVIRYQPRPAPMRAHVFMTPAGDLGGRLDPRLEWLDLIQPTPTIERIEGSNSGDALGQANVQVFGAALSALLRTEPDPA